MLTKPDIGAPCNGCGLCCTAQVCSAGSYALGLVEKWGARAKGPCPALVLIEADDRLLCGIMLRPKDWLPHRRGQTLLRKAFGLLIGVGAGCDEAGDEPEAKARPKIEVVQSAYTSARPIADLQAAADIIRAR